MLNLQELPVMEQLTGRLSIIVWRNPHNCKIRNRGAVKLSPLGELRVAEPGVPLGLDRPPLWCASLSYTRKVTRWTDPLRFLNTILPEDNKWVSTACLFNLSPRPSHSGKGLWIHSELFPPMHLLFWVICICSMTRLFIKFLIKKFSERVHTVNYGILTFTRLI